MQGRVLNIAASARIVQKVKPNKLSALAAAEHPYNIIHGCSHTNAAAPTAAAYDVSAARGRWQAETSMM